jgi:hypothetical protein
MRSPASVPALERLGRARLSENFFLRDFLFSDVAAIHGLSNIPDNPDLAIRAGKQLCTELLEPLQSHFGRVAIRSAYRSSQVNALCNEHYGNCASNAANAAGHIWDRLDEEGCMGATACVVLPRFLDRIGEQGDWRPLAWWVHDHLPYSDLQFFPRLLAFNIRWRERPRRRITSFVAPRGLLTKPGMENHQGSHRALWRHLARPLS